MFLVLCLATCLVQGSRQSYVGADGAIRLAMRPPKPGVKATDPNAGFKRSVEEYRAASKRLTPEESARRWVAIMDACPRSQAMWQLQSYDESNFGFVMSVFPSPSAWPHLEKVAEQRLANSSQSTANLALLAFTEALQGKRQPAITHLKQIKTMSPELKALVANVLLDVALIDENPDEIIEAYHGVAAALSGHTQPIGGDKSMALPDLTAILGDGRGPALVKDLLETFDGEFVVNGRSKFKKLVREIATADIANLKHPQWSLALDAESGPFVQALLNRFPHNQRGIQQNPDWAINSYGAAVTRYLMYLVANGRSSDAAKFAKSQNNNYWMGQRVPGDEVALLESKGKIGAYAAFLESQITSGNGEFVRNYTGFCEAVGLKDRSRSFVAKLPRKLKADSDDPVMERVDDLVGKGKIAEAGKYLSNEVKTSKPKPSNSGSSDNRLSRLMDIGLALHRKDFTDLALAEGKRALIDPQSMSVNDWVVDALVRTGRVPEAEQVLAKSLQRAMHQTNVSPPGGQEQLKSLVDVYCQSGRYADVVTLLEEGSSWGIEDLSELREYGQNRDSTVFEAAKALAGVGRRQEGLRVLLFALDKDSDSDSAYELLVDKYTDMAAPILEKLHRRNPGSTRPLIWRARLLQLQGRLAEAAALIKYALELDPVDSQAWTNRRWLQAYAILAGIERAQGLTTQATIHQRLFDLADQNKAASSSYSGLDLRGISGKLKILETFPDNYMLRFSLTEDLMAAGKKDTAKAQFLDAYRRLSRHVGREGQASVWVTEISFNADVESLLRDEVGKRPSDLGAKCVLGEFYLAESKPKEAETCFDQVVAADRNYAKAWASLARVSLELDIPLVRRDQIVVNVVRLGQGQYLLNGPGVRDFGRFWDALESAQHDSLDVPTRIFALPASEVPESDRQNVDNTQQSILAGTVGGAFYRDKTINDFGRLLVSIGKEKTE